MTPRTLLIAAAIAVTTPLLATGAIAKEKREDAEQANSEKKVCRYDSATGSMMRKRICHTAAEWKQIDDANSANARDMVNHNNMNRPAIGQ